MSSEDERIERLEKEIKQDQRKLEAKSRDNFLAVRAADARVRGAKARQESERDIWEREREWGQRPFEGRVAMVKASCEQALQWIKPRVHFLGGYADLALESMERQLAKDFPQYRTVENLKDGLDGFIKAIEHRFPLSDPVYSAGRDLIRIARLDCSRLQTELLTRRRPRSN
jgi:hypothetical protein